MRRLFDLWRDERGNTALIFGLAIVPLLALGGGSLDIAQRARAHSTLQTASDTAALAAARLVQQGLLQRDSDWDSVKAQATAMANNFITASLANLGGQTAPTVDIQVTQKAVTISSHFDMKTAFLGIIGLNTLPASTFAQVDVPDPILVEISLVLDYSLSMNQNSKYTRMTTAARDFIAKVAANRADRTKIGIVPFSEFVYANVADTDVRAPDTSGSHPWDGGSNYDGSGSWGSGGTTPTSIVTAKCLVNRDYPYSVTNETPVGATASKWQQADPNGSRCKRYEEGGLQARDLTNDFTGLSNALAGMQPVGWTNIALAAEMGWHMLSPNEPFETARDFSDPYVRKILILLTDGVQTIDAMGPTGEVSIDGANRTTAELCENAKADNISIYTIAYDVDDTNVYSLLSDCASGPSAYFEVHDSSGIGAVFDAIYDQIAEFGLAQPLRSYLGCLASQSFIHCTSPDWPLTMASASARTSASCPYSRTTFAIAIAPS